MDGKMSLKNIGLIVLGNFILAFAISFFIFPNAIVTGGVSGLATIFFPTNAQGRLIFIYSLEIVVFILGLVFLGKEFALKTFVSTLTYPVLVTLMQKTGESMSAKICGGNDMLASMYGGILIGIGVGIVFRAGGSTGGMDIPPLIVHKYTDIPVNKLVFITDGLTVLLGMGLRGIEASLIGLISVFLCSVLVNKTLMLGMEEAKSLMIISDKYVEIKNGLSDEIQRGATIIDAHGGYTDDPKKVLMVVISKQQFNKSIELIKKIDESAFVVVHDVNEVQGLGFSYDN